MYSDPSLNGHLALVATFCWFRLITIKLHVRVSLDSDQTAGSQCCQYGERSLSYSFDNSPPIGL